ncbi:pentapeptide repeat-containing protein [Ornithinimicrobium sp. LYQ92]|uniref:pentapeptide repeat-containing protein n=1 Tax=Serinicoccus sp. LYQ92 TaxID=3378798 RepID=UPI0038553A6B
MGGAGDSQVRGERHAAADRGTHLRVVPIWGEGGGIGHPFNERNWWLWPKMDSVSTSEGRWFWVLLALASCGASLVVSKQFRAWNQRHATLKEESRRPGTAVRYEWTTLGAEQSPASPETGILRKVGRHFQNSSDAYIHALVVGSILAAVTICLTNNLEERSLERQETYQRALVEEQAISENVSFVRSVAVQEARTKPFRRLNLTGADLGGLRLGCQPSSQGMCQAGTRADLDGSNLTGAVMYRINLRGADLTGAALSRADLERAVLDHAILRDADVSDVEMNRASLVGADLTGADLTGANLEGADLTDATLTGALLTGANMADVILTNAHLDCTQHSICADGK